MPEVSKILTDVCFWSQVIRDQERTWVCVPELEQQLRDLVEAHGLSHLITVMGSIGCPPNQVLIIDEQAQKAALAEWTSKPMVFPRGKTTFSEEFDEF